MTTVGYATLDVIPVVKGLRAQLDKQVGPGLVAAGRRGGQQFGTAAGTAASQGFTSKFRAGLDDISGGKLLAGLGIAAAGKAVIGLQAQFESSINVLGESADLTSAQMGRMADFAKEMGAQTVFSAGEAADAMVELAKAGIAPAAIQAGALKATMAVAATEGLQLADAATIVSNAMTTFGLKGEQATEVADALAGGSKASTASVSSLSEAMSQVGGSARDAGLSLQETVAVLSAFDQEGIKGSDAGTSLKTMLSRLVPQTKKAANEMADLGLNFTDATGSFLPMADIAEQLRTQLGGLSDAERTAALNTIFGSDARRAAIALMHQGADGMERFTQATSEAGAAQRLADARMKGTAGALEKMKGSIETAGLAFGEVLAPAVVVVADGLSTIADAATKIPAPVKAATLALVALKVASSFGPNVSPTASLSRGLEDVRLRTMLAADAFRQARAGSTQMRMGMETTVGATGRLSASLRSVSTFATGAGGALRRGLGGAIGMLGGPWGIALATGAAALVKFRQGQAEAKARVDELSASLDQQTGAITKTTEEMAFKALQDKGAIDLAKQYGISLDDLRGAALGNADASKRVNDALNEQAAAYAAVAGPQGQLSSDALTFADDANTLRSALGGQNGELQKAKDLIRDQADFMSEGTEVTKTAADATDSYASRLDEAGSALERLLNAENERAKNAIRRRRDEIALRDAMRSAKEEAADGTRVLFNGTKAADENMSALVDLADQWLNTKPSIQNAKGAYANMRQEFVNVATQMGATKKQAQNLADELLKVPKKAPVKFQSEGYADLLRQIRELQRRLGILGVTVKYPGTNKPVAPTLERAGGGPIYGPGTKTSDSVLMWGSQGEFMQRARAVDYYGLPFMHAINNLQFPKLPGYAGGGPIQTSRRASSPGAGVNIGTVVVNADSFDDILRGVQKRTHAAMSDNVRRGN